VPWEQRPVNELAQLRKSWLFSWVRARPPLQPACHLWSRPDTWGVRLAPKSCQPHTCMMVHRALLHAREHPLRLLGNSVCA